jgi:hypothetical protein
MSNKDIVLTEKQSLMITTTANETFAGGSSGGGKTYANKIMAIMVAEQVPGAQIAVLRNTYKNLMKNYFMGSESLPDLLKSHIKSKLVKINYSDMVVSWENGSAIHCISCENAPAAIDNLTGLEFSLIIFDEGSLIDSSVILHSLSRLRLGSLKIESDFWRERLPRLAITSNPGGISHNFLKARYISPAPPGTEFINEHGKKLLFIPFGAKENPHVDFEAYTRELASMGDPIKYRRLALGDWDCGEGTFFEHSFRRHKNVVPTFPIPKSWVCRRSFDHGYSAPFCVLWIAEVRGENEVTLPDGKDLYLPNGSFVVFEEWYGCNNPKDRNQGMRFSATEIASGILKREEEFGMQKRIKPGPADNSIHSVLSEKSIADEMRAVGVVFTKSDKSPGSRSRGWQLIADMMKTAHVDGKIEKPCLVFQQHCVELITDISTIPVSKKSTEDVDTTSTDHTLDALRYAIATPVKQAGSVATIGL